MKGIAKDRPQTRLKQKALLLLFGIGSALLVVELVLRIGGAVFLGVQGHRNKVALNGRGDYRVLCLGESMTGLGGDHGYPRQLEDVLNSSQKKAKFTVINKGIPSITTFHIVARMQEYLDEYQPQIVTVMMGINDGANFKCAYERENCSASGLWRYFRLAKLFTLLKARLIQGITDVKIRNVQKRVNQLQKYVDTHPSSNEYNKLAALHRVLLHWDLEERDLLKAVELNPRNYEALGYLGVNSRRRGEYAKSIEYFKRAVDCSPDHGDFRLLAYTLLAEAYTLSGQLDLAEKTHFEALERVPGYLNGYYFIGDLYFQQNRIGEAIPMFRKQLETNPGSALAYGRLANCLRKQGLNDTAERLLRQGIQLNPRAPIIYAELGSQLIEQKKYQEAEEVVKKALQLKKDLFEGIDINLLDYLLKSYEGQKKEKEAAELRKVIQNYDNYYNFETYLNYQKLQEILARKNVLLVAVQYPVRNVESLSKMLNLGDNTIVVDNEKIFKDAIFQKGYDSLFVDRFAGDFGHCTPEGYRMIAENIARSILSHLRLN